ncbi:nucleotidyltransferase family protein [Roseovarius spongiae]|uniref:Nucleotidyltransferase family protein n=1 Tax=Roseovarius spongiae TaxID=2320272 RepID=A0A3A8AXS8_9RHOB|nr:nucleotidyltransferase family protein [Roseovarius spongiae]RKF17283.1 nucleotidyltransferase family protein [Roseovarius spongiae]
MPAAGASSRMFGRDKLMEKVAGEPLLARQVARALASGARVWVTTRADRPARMRALEALAQERLTLVPVAQPFDGLSASLRAGIEALPGDVAAAMILLPDLPEIETDDLRAMIAAHEAAPDAILRATAEDGRPGHPVILPRALFPELMKLTGDRGAGVLLRDRDVTPVPLPGARAITDLDSPEDWAAWRARTGL